MDLGLRGRVAIVCAASQGLGKATAQALVREGAHVVIAARDRKRLGAAAKEIAAAAPERSGLVLPYVTDLTNARAIRRLVAAAAKRFGRIDILVTNAGGPPLATFPELTDEAWEKGVTLTLMSAVRCIREVLPFMRKQQWGRIVCITSIAAKQPVNDLVLSSSVRPGILGLVKVLANQYGQEGILVNAVAPGYILTARQKEISTARAQKSGMPLEKYMAELAAGIPLGRYGEPGELADVIAFLCSERASYVNGATVGIDGGLAKGLF
jgi:3-oxoacyl-[acyl-carrier protein] reductase